MTTFKELGLNSEILKSLDELGFVNPLPIQEKAIPFILESKKDLIALAQTGTGKTAAFGLPILNKIKKGGGLQAIILCPTRELCIQISQDIKKFSKYTRDISTTAVYGGERIDLQIRALKRGTNIVVGTPGRVCDLIRRKVLKLQSIEQIVLDEADEMLDMGFKDDLDAVLLEIPETKQVLLFSATISKSVHSIAKQYMNDAEEISIGEKNVGADNVSHEYYIVQNKDRFEALRRVLDSLPGIYGIIFCRTKNQTQEIADNLKQFHYNVEALHGDVSQNMRTKIMDKFKKKQIQLLVATDVAARGIDVDSLSHVINYNLPDQNESYVHRSGRTGRAQKSGVSLSIVNSRELGRIRSLESIIGKKFEHKKIPSGEDVCIKQIDSFLGEMSEIDIEKKEHEKYFFGVTDKLKEIKKEDLIKSFISHKFGHLMNNYGNARDLNSTVKQFDIGGGNSINLKANIGKKHGMNIKELFSLINSNKKLQGVDIGQISIMPEHLIFSIEKKNVDRVVQNLNKMVFKGNKISVNKSSESANYSRRSSSRNSRRRGGKSRRRKY